MADQRLLRLTNLDAVPPARLNRVRVRVTFDPTGNGKEKATLSASLNDDGTVVLPENMTTSAKPLSAQVVDVRGGVLQEIDLSGVELGGEAGPLGVEALEGLRERLSQAGPVPVRRWIRNGRITVLGQPNYSFEGFQLFVAPTSKDAARATYRGLGGSGDMPGHWNRPTRGDLSRVPVHEFQHAHLGFDGHFDFQTKVPDDSAGWVWMLSGPVSFMGFRAEEAERSKAGSVALVLELPEGAPDPPTTPEGGQPEAGKTSRTPPMDATEAEILENAELFSDDPGPFCRPFQNPGRILGERRFHTVLRVEQPEIAAAAGIRLEAAADRIREAGERILEEGASFEFDPSHMVDGILRDRPGSTGAALFGGFRSPLLDPAGPGRGRTVAGADNLIDWEGDTSGHQAVTVSGGHILEWRVRWRSNGYSLGNVNHTLTLAPRQIKRIMKVDWERREASARREELRFEEEAEQSTEASRDYRDSVAANLSEWSRGSSTSKTRGVSAGYGQTASVSAPVAPGVIVSGGSASGIGAGMSQADAEAEQEGERSVSASEEQKLRDAIRQHGEALRRLESTIITETRQEESVEGVSEVIANPNYCHALSVIYYDILRHLRVDTELAGVSECLFVPFAITPFSSDVFTVNGRRIAPGLDRVLRYRQALEAGLKDRSLGWVFRYLDDYARNGNQDIPDERRVKQRLVGLSGVLDLEMFMASPLKGDEDERASEPENGDRPPLERIAAKTVNLIHKAFKPFKKALGGFARSAAKLAGLPVAEREKAFQRDFAPALARHLVDRLRLTYGSGGEVLTADFTLDGNYQPGGTHKVYFRIDPQTLEDLGVTREDITTLKVHVQGDPVSPTLLEDFMELMGGEVGEDEDPDVEFLAVPGSSYANVKRIRVRYRTEEYERSKRSARGAGDLLRTAVTKEDIYLAAIDPDGAILDLPPDAYENRNLREEIHKGVLALLDHLNGHLHYYHKQIWWRMDRDELYQLLDGYMLSTRDRRSIASVVEREPLAILGNTLVFRVAPGAFIGVNGYDSLAQARAEYEEDAAKSDPMRISLPTGGVYAQALKDPCNACEEHYGNTDWVLERDELLPQEIESGLLATRRAEPSGLKPTQLPETLINLQNAPPPPAPSGTEGILRSVTDAGAFRDMADLAGTQANARAALEASRRLASEFGNLAAKEADANRAAMERIERARISAEAKDIASKPLREPDQGEDGDRGGRDPSDRDPDGGDSDDTGGGVAEGSNGGSGDGEGSGEGAPRRPRPRPRTNEYFRVLSPTHVLFLNFPVGGHEPASQHLPHIRATLERIEGARSVRRIQGHASRTGSEDDNLDLSQRRAMALLEIFEDHSQQSWPRALVESFGESEPTIRSTWGAKVQDIPGQGHSEDPVERSVLVEFIGHTFEEEDRPDPAPDAGIIFIDDRHIRIGDTAIAVSSNNVVQIVEGATFIEGDTIHEGDTIVYEGDTHIREIHEGTTEVINQTVNVQVLEGGDTVMVDGHEVRIVDGTFRQRPNGVGIGGDPKTKHWDVTFKTPELGHGESLFDVIRRFTREILLEREEEESPPEDEPSFLSAALPETIDVVTGEFEDLVDHVVDEIFEKFLEKLPNPALQLARVLKFGSARVPVTITNLASGEMQDGTLRGQALIMGTGGPADLKTLNMEEREYTTSEARTLASWDGETMETCALVLQPVSQMVSQIFGTLEFVAQWAEGALGLDWIDRLSSRLDEWFQSAGLDRARDSLQGGQIQFRADAGEQVHHYPATAPSVDITAVFYGSENASFEAD